MLKLVEFRSWNNEIQRKFLDRFNVSLGRGFLGAKGQLSPTPPLGAYSFFFWRPLPIKRARKSIADDLEPGRLPGRVVAQTRRAGAFAAPYFRGRALERAFGRIMAPMFRVSPVVGGGEIESIDWAGALGVVGGGPS